MELIRKVEDETIDLYAFWIIESWGSDCSPIPYGRPLFLYERDGSITRISFGRSRSLRRCQR